MQEQEEIWKFVEAYLADANQDEKVTLTSEFVDLFEYLYRQLHDQERFDKSCENDRVKGQDNNHKV